MTAPGCPCQRCGPVWIIRQPRLRAASEEELDHQDLTELGSPAKRCRTNILVAGMNIGAVVKEDRGVLYFTLPGKLVQGCDSKPVRMARIHAVREEELVQFVRAGGHSPSL